MNQRTEKILNDQRVATNLVARILKTCSMNPRSWRNSAAWLRGTVHLKTSNSLYTKWRLYRTTIMTLSLCALAIFLNRSFVLAHVVMNTPLAFPNLKPQTNPLGGTFQFPCQFGPDANYDFSQSTNISAGTTTTLSFFGSAVHGGGSCQISLSRTASLDSKDWKVIHTIIGGCPATVTQNANLIAHRTYNGYPTAESCDMADSQETDCMKEYNIPIPSALADGKYFFAWTWVSHWYAQFLLGS
jgi:hypothetical protein